MEGSVSILKFGGTSLGNGERICQVAQIVVRQVKEDFPAVVVPAMAGVTDQLLHIISSITAEFEMDIREIDSLKAKHYGAAKVVASSPDIRAEVLVALEIAFVSLEHDIACLYEVRQNASLLPLRTAAVAAWGERLSVILVTAAIRACGVTAEGVREEVISTQAPRRDISYKQGTVISAEPRPAQTYENAARLVVPLLERGVVPVMAGFIGRT